MSLLHKLACAVSFQAMVAVLQDGATVEHRGWKRSRSRGDREEAEFTLGPSVQPERAEQHYFLLNTS